MANKLISIVVPVYNESANAPLLHQALVAAVSNLSWQFEFIFIDDGSRDHTVEVVRQLSQVDRRVRLIELARNFGKEIAVTAGLHAAKGKAAIIMDADLQHPPKLIKLFIAKWQRGAQIVVGVRNSVADTWFKRVSSFWFYKLMRLVASTDVTPQATDFRLLDRKVINEFNRFTERNRLTRGLIDWLGFTRAYIRFNAPARQNGERSYSYRQLLRLAVASLTAHSLVPLKMAGYLGVIIACVTGPLGIFMYIERNLFGDPYNFNFTGTALLAVLLMFLVGVILMCVGLVALYIAQIHAEVINRPLYVIQNDSGEQMGDFLDQTHSFWLEEAE